MQQQDEAMTFDIHVKVQKVADGKIQITISEEVEGETIKTIPDGDIELEVILAKYTKNRNLLGVWSSHENSRVRREVAMNFYTDEGNLSDLACDDNLDTQLSALGNPHQSPYILRSFAYSQDWRHRYAVAGNICTPEDVLEELKHDSRKEVSNRAQQTLRRIEATVANEIKSSC